MDVTPSRSPSNLERLAGPLEELDSGLCTAPEPEGVPFPFGPGLLESSNLWTLVTKFDDLDLVMSPAGTDGYADLSRDADDLRVSIDPELTVSVISLADVIRSKEAAGREKDRAALPLLRRTLEETGS